MVMSPALQTKMASQMMGPAQHLRKMKKNSDNIMAAAPATTKTIHPCDRS